MSGIVVTDVRRRVAALTQGLTRMLIFVQSAAQDVGGALHAGQLETFRVQVRSVVIDCLAIRSALRSGEVLWTNDGVTGNPFAGCSSEEVESGLRLLRAAAEVEGPEEATAFLAAFDAFIAATELALGFDGPLPALRSPDGMFGAIRLARGAFEAVEHLHLPPLLPPEWLGETADDEADGGHRGAG
ncbi:MAG: hypothetical protein JWM47_839 [Acidimicrobiales bacterium]|nr:hypothetical protein [Acidimicrobiales bacterium]